MKLRAYEWMIAGLFVATITGCVGNFFTDPILQQARTLIEQGQGEQGLDLLDKAANENPRVYIYRTEYFRQRDMLLARRLAQADALAMAGQFDMAAELYRRVQRYDPQNARASTGLAQIETERRHRNLIADADKLVKTDKYREAEDVLRPVLVENPQNRDARRLQRLIDEKTMKPAIMSPRLTAAALKPLTLELRDVPLRAIFDVISRAIGINFVFDKDVRTDQRTGLAIQDSPAEEVIRLLLATNQLEQKIVNERTLLIFPNTPQKLREYQELVVKSFYLSNADVRQTATMIRTLVKTRDIFIDEKLNLLIIKDTPSAVRLAERLIAAQDLADPEVMLEVEVMEVSVNKLLELGVKFPDFASLSLRGNTSNTPGTYNLNRDTPLWTLGFPNPLLLLNLRQTDGATNVLANPRIRVKNKGKARIHIGDKVPVITTTAAATGGFVSENVSYLDVGLKLEVEPLIHLEDEVAINVGLEVSNITDTVKSTAGNTLAYQIGTRNATTVLRLRDGETQVLAGLINDADRRTAARVPGIGELPIFGRLFSQTRDETLRSEIVLLITPRVIRALTTPEARSLEFSAGTEASTGAGSGGIVPFTPPVPPIAPPQPKPAAPPPSFPTGPQPPSQSLLPPPSGPAGGPPTGVPPPAGPLTPSPAPAPPPGTLVPFGGVQTP